MFHFSRDKLDRMCVDHFFRPSYFVRIYTTTRSSYQKASCGGAVTHLIIFEVIEWPRLDRAMRQFGLLQLVPHSCNTNLTLHDVDKRSCIALWKQRYEHIVLEDPSICPMLKEDPYMVSINSETVYHSPTVRGSK